MATDLLQDAQLASYLESLCHNCEYNQRNAPYNLCVECYGCSRDFPDAECETCKRTNCICLLVPSENASFEAYIAFAEAVGKASTGTKKADLLRKISPKQDVSCCICLDTSPDARLPCGHTMHLECGKKALSYDSKCPVCRDPV